MSITCKQPNAEPTAKQLEFFNTLLAERGYPTVEKFADGCTRQEASDAIEAAKTLPKAKDAPVAAAKPSLMEMAAQITGQAPPERMAQIAENFAAAKAAKPVVAKPEFTDQELSTLRSAISVTIGETDGTPTDHDLYERIDAYLASKGL